MAAAPSSAAGRRRLCIGDPAKRGEAIRFTNAQQGLLADADARRAFGLSRTRQQCREEQQNVPDLPGLQHGLRA